MNIIKSVDKASRILDYIADHNGQSTLTEISNDLDIVISTLSGFLYTLEQLRYIRKNTKTGCYSLDIHTFQLGIACNIQSSLQERIHPYILSLSKMLNETIHLAVSPDQTELIYIDKAECNRPFRMTSMVGTTEPLCQSAPGAILAYDMGIMTEEKDLRNNIYSSGNNTYCKKYDEETDTFCIAVSLKNKKGIVMASISTVVAAGRLSVSFEDYILSSMFSMAEIIKTVL